MNNPLKTWCNSVKIQKNRILSQASGSKCLLNLLLWKTIKKWKHIILFDGTKLILSFNWLLTERQYFYFFLVIDSHRNDKGEWKNVFISYFWLSGWCFLRAVHKKTPVRIGVFMLLRLDTIPILTEKHLSTNNWLRLIKDIGKIIPNKFWCSQ